MLLSQLNRSTDGRPNLKNLRDSGMIEEIADEVWFLYRSAYEKEAMEEIKKQKAELIMAKGRTLGKGFVELVWYPEIQVFQDAYLDKHGEEIEIVRG
jgi:replicative DNA helicase